MNYEHTEESVSNRLSVSVVFANNIADSPIEIIDSSVNLIFERR